MAWLAWGTNRGQALPLGNSVRETDWRASVRDDCPPMTVDPCCADGCCTFVARTGGVRGSIQRGVSDTPIHVDRGPASRPGGPCRRVRGAGDLLVRRPLVDLGTGSTGCTGISSSRPFWPMFAAGNAVSRSSPLVEERARPFAQNDSAPRPLRTAEVRSRLRALAVVALTLAASKGHAPNVQMGGGGAEHRVSQRRRLVR